MRYPSNDPLIQLFQATFHHGEVASHAFILCFILSLNLSIISWELLLISNLVAINTRARSSPSRTTSYSALLLEVEKLRWIACSISSPVGDCRIKPTLDLNTLDVPSTRSVHHCSPGQSEGWVSFLGSLAIKSAITCPFNDNLGWYLISYSLNSMAHFNICPDRSSLCRVARSGWFVSTVTWWA